MTHHLLPQLPRDWITALTNVLLIRDPAEVVASYVRSRADVSPRTSDSCSRAELYDQLGAGVPVIDAADFLRDPEDYLRWLCDYIDVEFTDRMLHWPAGPRDSDGVWAPYWYGAVLASTGFEPYRPRQVELTGAGGAAATTQSSILRATVRGAPPAVAAGGRPIVGQSVDPLAPPGTGAGPEPAPRVDASGRAGCRSPARGSARAAAAGRRCGRSAACGCRPGTAPARSRPGPA